MRSRCRRGGVKRSIEEREMAYEKSCMGKGREGEGERERERGRMSILIWAHKRI
jgi:hypothetical protein